jgi:hypothetical protein
MTRRNNDPLFDDDQIREEDPLGEIAFDAAGFEDQPGGGPALEAPGMEDEVDKRPGGHGQKVAGIPEAMQREPNTGSVDRPDTQGAVIRERGGASKGDPAVGGTRPE